MSEELLTRLDRDGFATTGRLLSDEDCAALIATWQEPAQFRSRITMARHGFGQGEYRYFANPLPDRVTSLRESWYAQLAPAANRWAETLGLDQQFEATHAAFRARCHANEQRRPTPLLLRYTQGDYNRLHQDLYGTVYFPFQLVILLSQPTKDFDGGEFVLTERLARMQTRVDVVPLQKGDGVIFATRERPVPSARGSSRAEFRHGVSRIRGGERFTLGVVFHDAA
ncbi:2OG-Fe(II) oxygenase [Roseiterribacter gracilis]|uniref:Prolyl 4-hydroxylase n=1 Tax=Roseiterribacter gracilis TaxID=2812848 RepID=A0A8S8X8R2_9PROT|nr:prolyl 4-hydroxylase [Rhodospirillales bacterium TMPK1]